ncbi:MAG: DUF1669 domain-containing protein [Arcobacteraceae bacterium]|nr:DUF1669 domain-containing protein [Arcobacteraceae bacterium]
MFKYFTSLVLFIFITSTSVYAKDEIYFLPKDSQIVKERILKIINNADKKIDIAMYNFSYKKFHKALKKASKKSVDVTIIYGKSKLKFYKKLKLIQTKRKQHIKLAIIDNKFAIFGSANWTKESFEDNYEIINITDDKQKVKEFIKIFKELKEEN